MHATPNDNIAMNAIDIVIWYREIKAWFIPLNETMIGTKRKIRYLSGLPNFTLALSDKNSKIYNTIPNTAPMIIS
jgi:hypothetical protein